MKNLFALQVGDGGRVAHIEAEGGMLRRLMDLGFTRGARVECLLQAPFHGMRAYGVRGSLVALREKDAKKVWLEDEGHG